MIDHARLLDFVEHLLRRQQCAVDVGRRQHDRELVAAQPRHGVGVGSMPRTREATHCRIRSPA